VPLPRLLPLVPERLRHAVCGGDHDAVADALGAAVALSIPRTGAPTPARAILALHDRGALESTATSPRTRSSTRRKRPAGPAGRRAAPDQRGNRRRGPYRAGLLIAGR
jgi:hypothetical protein